MRVVRNRPQHRPNDRTTEFERAFLVDPVSQNGRNLFAARFDVVVMRQGGSGDDPFDRAVGLKRPTRFPLLLLSVADARHDAQGRYDQRG